MASMSTSSPGDRWSSDLSFLCMYACIGWSAFEMYAITAHDVAEGGCLVGHRRTPAVDLPEIRLNASVVGPSARPPWFRSGFGGALVTLTPGRACLRRQLTIHAETDPRWASAEQ